MKRLVLALMVLSVLFALAPAPVSAQIGTTTWTASPAPGLANRDANIGFDTQPFAAGRVSVVNYATTTAKIITPLVGRKMVRITAISAGAGPETVWVAVGTTTAAINTGIPVVCYASGTTLNLPYDSNIPMGISCAAATVVSVVQEGPFGRSTQRQ